MEWTIRWWQVSIKRVYPTSDQLSQTYSSGLLGWLIQWYWGNDCFSQKALVEMLTQAGLTNVQFYPFTVGVSRWTSIACVGFKP